ncbi:DUF6314 family protein [Streptomyces sp. NPDC057757]|uniref:DUF6314 family protein n=1 Tax=Streptomyces sp. NPDC057757 TaxID=3346241 RepID=UPI0036BC0029
MGEFWPVADLLAYLAGDWRVERTVRDLTSGAEGHFTGTTVFGPLEDTRPLNDTRPMKDTRPPEDSGPPEDRRRPEDSDPSGDPRQREDSRSPENAGPPRAVDRHPGLLHHESGTFVWQGTPRPAERTLWFLPGQGAGTADVRFSDGRPFHDLDLTSGRFVADHPCSADLYRGEFTALDAHRWRTVWRVAGPAKDLVLTTDYTREA